MKHKHMATFTVDVYTNDENMSRETFENFVLTRALLIETEQNEDMRLRWTVHAATFRTKTIR